MPTLSATGTTLDLGGRGSGKTTRALEWALADPASRVIVVPYEQARSYLLARAKDLGIQVEVWSWQSFLTQARGSTKEFWIDELLACLPTVRIAGVSGL